MENFETLFDLIGELARRRYGAAERAFAAIGLHHTEARLLTLLSRDGGKCTQDALSARIVVDRSNAGRALKQLEHAGLIQRRKDAADKRANLVEITPEGRKAVARIARIRTEIASTFFGDLTNDEAGTVLALLGKVLEADRHA